MERRKMFMSNVGSLLRISIIARLASLPANTRSLYSSTCKQVQGNVRNEVGCKSEHGWCEQLHQLTLVPVQLIMPMH